MTGGWPAHLPGVELCRSFFAGAVEPLLAEACPGLRYAAARIGPGSDVLGFDTARSVDHDWGPRLEIFCTPGDLARHGARLSALLAHRLPRRFHGWPTHFAPPGAAVRTMADTGGPVAHLVRFTDLGAWSTAQLGFDPRDGVTTFDWLATPAQRLAEVTGGAVYRDDDGALTALRRRLHWYPGDVWRYVLAGQWQRIGQEEAFVGRAAEAGDDSGARIVAARLAREVLRLCLLLGRRYPPYGKWLGSAAAAVEQAAPVRAALAAALRARTAAARQSRLCEAYEAAGRWQNRLGLCAAVPAVRRPFYDRPYPVIGAGRFAGALYAALSDPAVAALPRVGPVDQVVDSTEVLTAPPLCRAVMAAVLGLPAAPPARPDPA